MKNKKRNILLSVAFAAIAFAAFSFVAPESNNVSSENQHFSTVANSAYGSIPADFVSAKCGSETSKTEKKVKKGKTEGKCGAGKCGSKDVKAAKKVKKSGKCGEGKCGSKEAKTEKKAEKKAKKTEGKCGAGKCGIA